MSGEEKRGRGRPRLVDRDEAVHRALLAWWADGARGISLNEICRRSGLSKSSVYREYGGEDGLKLAALERYRELSVLPMLQLMAAPLPPSDVLDMLAHGLTASRGLPPGCFFTMLRFGAAEAGEPTAARVREIRDERLAAFDAWFRRVQAQGLADEGLRPEDAARYLDMQMTNALMHMGAGEPANEVRAQTRRALGVLLSSTT